MATINRTAVPAPPPKTLREIRLWHWFKAQAFRKTEAQYRQHIAEGQTVGYWCNRARSQAKNAEWHERAVQTLDTVVTGAALQDAIAKGYNHG